MLSVSSLQSKIFVTFAAIILSVSSAKADFRCDDAMNDLNSAQAGLQQATAVLGQLPQICGNNMACIVTGQNAYNNAVNAVNFAQQRKDRACRCDQAIANLNAAQNAMIQAQAILMNAGNICGGALPCIVTAQNAFNQAQANLNQAQQRKAQACDWDRDGDRDGNGRFPHRPGPGGFGGGGFGGGGFGGGGRGHGF